MHTHFVYISMQYQSHRTKYSGRVVVFVDEDNGDVDNIPSDGEGLDGNDETSDESEADSDVSPSLDAFEQTCTVVSYDHSSVDSRLYPP